MKSGQSQTLSKPPRRYAADYLKARTNEQRAEAVKGCPVEWRELVNTHVRIGRIRKMDASTDYGVILQLIRDYND